MPKIAGAEFEQCVAVAQLAVNLCELKLAQSKSPIEKENLDPAEFLDEAWTLIESARDRVLREQTDAEYLAAQGGSHEAAENVIERKLRASVVPFEKLCDPERKKGGTEIITFPDVETGKSIEVEWEMCRSEADFDNRFWALWNHYGEGWTEWMKGEKPRPLWMKGDAVTFAKLARNKEKYPGGFKQLWKERGQSMLACWKKDGVPRIHFLALASGYFDFELGVKFITGERRFDRALPLFRRFLKSRFANEDTAESAMAKYREEKFASGEPYLLKNEFAEWKREEKSRNAKLSRQARGKRGRVRSKSDKRLGARPPSFT